MICRIWHGWTKPKSADAYERLLRSEIFSGIASLGIVGYRGIQLLRREATNADGEVEFVTIMWFDSLADVRSFAGEEYDLAVVPPAARELLSRYDERSAHYEVRDGQPVR